MSPPPAGAASPGLSEEDTLARERRSTRSAHAAAGGSEARFGGVLGWRGDPFPVATSSSHRVKPAAPERASAHRCDPLRTIRLPGATLISLVACYRRIEDTLRWCGAIQRVLGYAVVEVRDDIPAPRRGRPSVSGAG